MRGPIYRYNPHTCQYERAHLSAAKVLSRVAGIALTSLGMLISLLLVHDYLVDTEHELTLRNENNALKKHSAILKNELSGLRSTLTELQKKDQQLHNTLFATVSNQTTTQKDETDDILRADVRSFRRLMRQLDAKSGELIANSASTSFHATTSIDVKSNLEVLSSIPTKIPVKSLTEENLISGFGMRINPFHKGLYKHEGIDIALPRGTEVYATCSGRVISAKVSNLQAGYGNFVEIDHGNGFVTRYAHLDELKVRVGQQVNAMTVIGLSGNSGGSVAPHLHYEIIRNRKNVDAVTYFIEQVSSDEHELLREAANIQNQSLD